MDEPLGALDALTREKMQGLVLKLWKETARPSSSSPIRWKRRCFWGRRLIVMAPRPGRIFREYRLPFAEMGPARICAGQEASDFAARREEILAMIWDMEEEIMGRTEEA